MIKNIGGIKEHNININTLNYISVHIRENFFFIHLNKKSSVDAINKIYLNSNNYNCQILYLINQLSVVFYYLL